MAGLLGQETGQISGVALDGEGQPLADHTVQLTRIVMVGGSRGEQVSVTELTNADGAFSFTGLQASDYLVEVLSGDEAIASTSVTLTDGAMQVSEVSVAPPAPVPESERSWWGRLPTGAKIGIVAGAVVGALVINCFTNVCGG